MRFPEICDIARIFVRDSVKSTFLKLYFQSSCFSFWLLFRGTSPRIIVVFREFLRTKAAVILVYHLMWCEYFTLTQGYPVTRLTVLHNCSFYVVVSSFETAWETMAAVYFSLRLCFFATLLFTIAGKYWIVLSGTWLTGKWAILISGTRSRLLNTA